MSRELVRLFRAEIVSWVLGTCLFDTLFPSKSFGTMFFYMKMCENPSIFQAKKSRGQPPVPGSSFRCLLRLVFCGMASRPQIYFFGCVVATQCEPHAASQATGQAQMKHACTCRHTFRRNHARNRATVGQSSLAACHGVSSSVWRHNPKVR